MELTLGFSPCPNDCFIFDAMIHGKIDTEGLIFRPVIEDVEALNKKALKQKLDITKLSFFALSKVRSNYHLLDSGAALGFGVGPLLLAGRSMSHAELKNTHLKVAIPGKNTTANLLFSLAFPHLKKKKEVLFSEIEDRVLSNEFDLGVVIHESRFTYKKKGLVKVKDLGSWWEKETGYPIPLGGIAARKNLTPAIRKKIERVIRKSVQYAFDHPRASRIFVKDHAQEMENSVIRRHIRLYVNQYSLSLGNKGHAAVDHFHRQASRQAG